MEITNRTAAFLNYQKHFNVDILFYIYLKYIKALRFCLYVIANLSNLTENKVILD